MAKIPESEAQLLLLTVREIHRGYYRRGEVAPDSWAAFIVLTGWGFCITIDRDLAATGIKWAHFADVTPKWELSAIVENAEWAAGQLDRKPMDPNTREVTL